MISLIRGKFLLTTFCNERLHKNILPCNCKYICQRTIKEMFSMCISGELTSLILSNTLSSIKFLTT